MLRIKGLASSLLFVLMSVMFVFTGYAAPGDGVYSVDKEFLSYLKQGKIKGLPVYLGMTRSDVIKQWGEPTEYAKRYGNANYNGCSRCKLDEIQLHFHSSGSLQSILLRMPKISSQQLIALLGKPDAIDGNGDSRSITTYIYEAGAYRAEFFGGGNDVETVTVSYSKQALNSKYPVKMFINAEQVLFADAPPILRNNRLYIAVPEFIHEYGGEVSWSEDFNSADILLAVPGNPAGKNAEFSVGRKSVKIGEQQVAITLAPLIVQDRLYVPFADFAKIFEMKYRWDPKQKAVLITK